MPHDPLWTVREEDRTLGQAVITYLKVSNLAIVEEFAIEPGAGFNVLTGETGAGKSLLIDSLEFLSGARGSTDSIRTGAEKMSAQAVFHLPAALAPSMEEAGVETTLDGDDLELIVKREIAVNGRGRVLLNGSPVAVRELQSVSDRILEIHGQALSHDRIAGQSFRQLLDQYGGHSFLLHQTKGAHEQWQQAALELRHLTQAQQDRSQRLDLLAYQIAEISGARLDPGEEGDLRSEKAILANAQELIETTASAFTLLDEAEDSALSQLARASQMMERLARSVEELGRIHGEIEEMRYRLQDTSRSLGHLGDSIKHDPKRLDEVEERLLTIEKLKKKYGGSIEAIVEHLAAARQEHETLTEYESNLDRLQQREEKTFAVYRSAAENLSASRRKAARTFQQAIQSELDDLAMERTTVRIDAATSAESGSRLVVEGKHVSFGPEGFDRIDILIAPNQGEELRPMNRIASGGELSRIQLAIAAALFKSSSEAAAATLVFDEIDSGIGGRVAEVVGKKLQELSRRNQVLCVTHLPQIASLATTHFRVWKEENGGRTRARIARLETREERIGEIARMLGGETVTDSARAHATELLRHGETAASGRKRTATPAPRNDRR